MSKKIIWTDQAKAQLRAIDKDTALRIFHRSSVRGKNADTYQCRRRNRQHAAHDKR